MTNDKTDAAAPRAWMRLPSGAHLDLHAPDPLAWTDRDLAMRLSRTTRWGGESAWPLPLSVAQHSLWVLQWRRQTASTTLDPAEALLELLHDAEEGFLGFDSISPLKATLGAPFQAVSQRLMDAVLQRYRLPAWAPDAYRLHKIADRSAAAAEAVHCVGWSPSEVRDVLGIQSDILDTDPLAARYGDPPWQPWPPETAARRFLQELEDLMLKTGSERSPTAR